jgi:hypothetical protein
MGTVLKTDIVSPATVEEASLGATPQFRSSLLEVSLILSI